MIKEAIAKVVAKINLTEAEAESVMRVMRSGTVMFVRLVQKANAELPMLAAPVGIGKFVEIVMVTRFNPVQPKNAASPMVVTLSGIVMLVRLAQSKNAPSPMLVTLLGIATLVRLVQP